MKLLHHRHDGDDRALVVVPVADDDTAILGRRYSSSRRLCHCEIATVVMP
jgi:hypothetical protein